MEKIQKKWIFNQCLYISKRFVLIYINFSFDFLAAKTAYIFKIVDKSEQSDVWIG